VSESQFSAVYGDVPIIRPGMTKLMVDELVGGGGSGFSIGGVINMHCNMHWTYRDGLQFWELSSSMGKISDCKFGEITITGPNQRESTRDIELMSLLQGGMTPREVEQKIGKPRCGIENEPGKVELSYPQPGIKIVYLHGRLLKWERTHFYRDEQPQETGNRVEAAQ
jgi:hypothetical protein